MLYALRILWFEKRRYLPAVLAVGFSGMLIAMQVGILIGLIGVVSVPIENSTANIWLAHPATPACDLGRPIPRYWIDRMWMHPAVQAADEYIQSFNYWKTLSGGSELVIIVGVNLDDQSLGPIGQLTPEQRVLLSEPGSVILDRRDAHRLEVDQVGQEGEVGNQRVRVVGFTQNMGSISGPYVVCSLQTARKLLRMREDQVTYLLARAASLDSAKQVVADMKKFPKVSAFEAEEFSRGSKLHWIRKTKAGIALGFAAVLGLAVGASITSQTLYAATAATLRELAVLRALGIPRWRMSLLVMQQSVCIGIFGLMLAAPVTFGLSLLATSVGARTELPAWLLVGTAAITLTMAVGSGLVALRSLRGADPALLLR